VTDEQAIELLDEIRPRLQGDGGDVEFVEIEGNVVRVRLKGACKGCPMAQMTLKQGIEAYMKKRLPELEAVEAV